jgi:hypothetical protein
MTQATEERTSISTPVPKEDLEKAVTLILAAPDLLEFAIEYLRLFDSWCVTNPSSVDKDFTGYRAEKAKAAIIKAIGEQP